MKKTFQTLAVVILLALPCVSLASVDRDLSYGSKGDDVSEVQDFLIDQGFLKGSTTGNYYSLTRTAVMKWQKSIGLPSSGYFGKMSREEFNAIADSAASSTDETVNIPIPTSTQSEYEKTLEANRKLSEQIQAQLNTQVIQPTPTSQPVQSVDSDALLDTKNSFNQLTTNLSYCINQENYALCPSISFTLNDIVIREISQGLKNDDKIQQISILQNIYNKTLNIETGALSTGTAYVGEGTREYLDPVAASLMTAISNLSK